MTGPMLAGLEGLVSGGVLGEEGGILERPRPMSLQYHHLSLSLTPNHHHGRQAMSFQLCQRLQLHQFYLVSLWSLSSLVQLILSS